MSIIHNKTKNNCICCEEKLTNGIVFLHKTRRQTHSLCENCAIGYIKPKIDIFTKNLKRNIKNKNYYIKCPGTYCSSIRNNCKKNIIISDIKIENKNLQLYIDLFRVNYVINNNNAIICMNDNCGEILHLDNLNYLKKITCPTCKSNWCINCLCEPYHNKISCIEYQYFIKKSENCRYILEMKTKGELKLCPLCNFPTLKIKNKEGKYLGCNKMICSNCNIKWCWLCDKFPIDYDHFNQKSNNFCANKLWKNVQID